MRTAEEPGLKLFSVTGHHCVENVRTAQLVAEDHGITVPPGMGVQTQEEMRIVCLFDDLKKAVGCQQMIRTYFPNLPNREEFSGAQYIEDSTGDYIRRAMWGGIAGQHVDR